MQRYRKPPPTGGRGLKKAFLWKKTFFLGSINKDLCEFGMDQRFFRIKRISILQIKNVKYVARLCLRCWFDSPLLFARPKSEDINGITTDRRSDEKPQL